MNASFENNMSFIDKIQAEIIRLKNEKNVAEKKNLNYEAELFNKDNDLMDMQKKLEHSNRKLKEAQLKINELERNLRKEKMEVQNIKRETDFQKRTIIH